MTNRLFTRALHLVAPALALAAVLVVPRAALAATTIAGGNIINKTWTPAGSPYIVNGDVTVPKGAFLNIEAGTVVQLASTDAQGANFDPKRVEFMIRGTLNVTGQAANRVQFRAQSGLGTKIWYGIVIDSTATSVKIAHATIANATNGIRNEAPGSVLSASNVAIDQSWTGVLIQTGTPTLTNISVSNSGEYGIQVNGPASPTIVSPSLINNAAGGLYMYSGSGTLSATVTNALIRNNGMRGVQLSAKGGALVSLSMTNATIDDNGLYGLDFSTGANSSVSVTIKNSIITNHLSSGLYWWNPGITANVTYSNVWGNGTNFEAPLAPGAGCISENPLYVAAPNDLRLAEGSVSIDAGTSMNAPKTDIEGKIRPIDGDGINGVEVDMGCYEYAPAFFEGDDLDGFGIDQKYGDGTVNDPEAGGEGGDSDADLADMDGESGCRTAPGNEGSPAGLVFVVAGALLAAKRRKRAA